MTDLRPGKAPQPQGAAQRWFSALAVALGLAPGAASAEAPRSVAPHAAPKAWLDYAQLVSDQVMARLGGDDPAAQRLRDYLNQLPGAAQPDGVALRISFWIDEAGAISRVDFPLFAQPEPNDDLKALVVGYRLSQAPPKDMVLPLRLAVHLKPPEDAASKPEASIEPSALLRATTSARFIYKATSRL